MPFLQKIQRDRGEPRAARAMNGDAEFAPIVAGEAEFVTGSRRPGSEETKDPIRRADVRFFALMVSVLTGQRISDTTFGLRAMRAEVTGAAPLEEPQYQASELPITVITHGYMVLEVPATIHKRKIGESKKGHNFNYGLRFMRVVITTWWRERRRDARRGTRRRLPALPAVPAGLRYGWFITGVAAWAGVAIGLMSGPREQAGAVPAVARTGVGSLVAGYRVEQEVARGGMAMVYRASDERLGRVVALKLMAADLAADAEFRARFLRECRAAAMVEDPHIIPVYRAGEADGVLFIAMRFVSGGDVSSLIRQAGPLSAVRVAGIVSPVASALDSLHQAGLVHRDVKPANMLLDSRPGRPDHVYLSDFGLTKGASSVTRLTETGQFLGTLDYVSPEQIGGCELDGRTDQYSLACAAFELLTGAPPFRRSDLAAAVGAHLIEPPPLVTAVRPDLPPAVDEVLARALAKQSDSRYPTCGDFADALRDALGVARYDAGQDVSPTRPAEAAAKTAGATAHGGPPAAIPDSPQTPASLPAPATPVTPAGLTASAGPSPVARRALPARVPGRRVRRLRALAVIGVALLAVGGGLAILLASSPTGGRTPAATGSSAGKRTPVHPAPARLVVQAMAAPGNSELSDVSAGPHGTAWAVGYSCTNCSNAANALKTLILHWDGTAWARVPSPSPSLHPPAGLGDALRKVSVAPDGTAWAIGDTCPAGQCYSLILRWDGTAWTRMPSPSPDPASVDDVSAAPGGTAWAIGTICPVPGIPCNSVILHWNGTTWTRVSSPMTSLDRLSAISTAPHGTAWAVGNRCHNFTKCSTLILHWNGTAWARAPSPSPRSGASRGDSLDGVGTAPDGTAWAVGSTCTRSGCGTLILHWNGTAWTRVPGPSPGLQDSLDDVSTAPDGTAWAVGSTCSGDCSADRETGTVKALILQWNGTTWVQVPSSDPGHVPQYLHAVATGPAGTGWAVGGTAGPYTQAVGALASPESVILHWSDVR